MLLGLEVKPYTSPTLPRLLDCILDPRTKFQTYGGEPGHLVLTLLNPLSTKVQMKWVNVGVVEVSEFGWVVSRKLPEAKQIPRANGDHEIIPHHPTICLPGIGHTIWGLPAIPIQLEVCFMQRDRTKNMHPIGETLNLLDGFDVSSWSLA